MNVDLWFVNLILKLYMDKVNMDSHLFPATREDTEAHDRR